MPLIVTPRFLKDKAQLYQQLASLTSAGVDLIQALELVRRSPPSGAFRAPLDRVLDRLKQSSTFTEALRPEENFLTAFDVALLESGEQSGRLDLCFRILANYYEDRASMMRRVLGDLVYPAFLLHMVILIMPISVLQELVLRGAVGPFLFQKLAVLVPIYGITLFIVYVCQGKHSERWRAAIEQVAKRIPVLGSARHNLALARLSIALEGLINAGMNICQAWELAADASGSPALRRHVASWRPMLEAGETPAELLQRSRLFPGAFASLYTTGELSGNLDETLRRLYNYHNEEGSRQMHAAATWSPRLAYLLMALLVAYQVVKFWQSYFAGINSFL